MHTVSLVALTPANITAITTSVVAIIGAITAIVGVIAHSKGAAHKLPDTNVRVQHEFQGAVTQDHTVSGRTTQRVITGPETTGSVQVSSGPAPIVPPGPETPNTP